MSIIPFLHHHPQTPLSTQANRNRHRRPWSALRLLALCLTITLSLGLIQPVLAALVWQIQVVDSIGQVGWYSSLALDSRGYPVISYYDASNNDLKLVRCDDATCSSGNTIRTVDSAGDVGWYTSLALDSNGNPVISYFDDTNKDLKLAHCGDATCSSGNTIRTVDSAGDVGWHTSLALDSNGNPVISYRDATNNGLKLVHCGNPTCSSGNSIQLLDGDRDNHVGYDTSLALDSNGNPVIAYYDNTNIDLKLVRCGNATCSSGNTIMTVDGPGDVGIYPSLALDSNDHPVISYWDEVNLNLKFVHCGDTTCSSGNIFQTVDSARYVGLYSSLTLNDAGNPVISYFDFTNENLKLVYCGDANCSSGNIIQVVDSVGDQGGVTSLALDSRGKPVISYFDFTNGDLKLARLTGDDTPPVITPTVTGTLGNNGWYTSDVTVSWSVVDAGSTISQSGCASLTLTNDTPSITLTCTATSEGGTSSQSVTLKLDKTPPTLAPVVSPNPVLLGGTATVTAGATDALSGVASESCGALDTSSVGIKSVTCTATDNAGNTASATVNYTVAYPWTGFFQPVDNYPVVNTVNAGQGIPVKFSLGGDYGLSIFASGYPASQKVNCGSSGSGGSTSPIEETVTPGNSTLQYNAATQTYTYIWKTDKAWAGSCRQLIVRLIDGTNHIALFQFNGKVRSADAEGDAEIVQQIFLPLVNR